MSSRSNRENRTFGAPTGVAQPSAVQRPRVGPADAATRRAALNQRLAQDERRAPAPRPRASASTPSASGGQPDAFKLDRAKKDLNARTKRLNDEIDRQSK